MDILRTILLFFFYGFLGWCGEEAFIAFTEGHFVNRGFLNGPICPIYGFGVVAVTFILHPIRENMLVLFLGSLLLASGIEFLTGWALEKLFHTKWWDYSEKPLNIHGYVCLRMSVLWGVACVIIVNSLYPLTVTIAEMIPQVAVIVMLAVFFILGAIDMAATLAAISQMSEKLAKLTEIAGEIHQVSDEIGHVISDSTLTAKRKASEGGALFTEKAQRFNELKDEKLAEFNDLRTGAAEKFKAAAKRMMALNERMLHLIGDMNGVQRRILKAFPTMKSSHYTEAMTALKAFYRRHRRENQE